MAFRVILQEPAVHITFEEAEILCKWRGKAFAYTARMDPLWLYRNAR